MARKRSPTPTEAELRLLRVLWDAGPAAASDLVDRLGEPRLAKNTVLTTLKILEEKGFVGHSVEGRTFVYRARKDPKTVRSNAVKQFVSRFFQDSPKELILHFLDAQYVDETQAARIRKLLSEDEGR